MDMHLDISPPPPLPPSPPPSYEGAKAIDMHLGISPLPAPPPPPVMRVPRPLTCTWTSALSRCRRLSTMCVMQTAWRRHQVWGGEGGKEGRGRYMRGVHQEVS